MLFRNLGSALVPIMGALLVASWNLAFAAEGDLDASFGNGGKSSADITGQLLEDAVGDLALLPEGRILVAGTTSSGFPSEHDVAVGVFDSDGSVATDFGQAGRVLVDLGAHEFCYAVEVQNDGRILLGGYRTALAGDPPQSLLLRLERNGVLDTTFGSLAASQPALPFAVVDLVVLPDGAVIAAGTRPSPIGSDFVIARLTTDGYLDETFGEGGMAVLDFGGDDYLTQLSLDSAGRLLAAGLNTAGVAQLARLLADGALDLTFYGTGIRQLDIGCSYDVSVALQPDGEILLGTTTGDGAFADFLLARLNADGSLDPNFGSGGFVTGDLTGTDDYLVAVAVEPDGKILAVGWAGFYPDFLVQRYNFDGSVDLAFGLGGWVHTDFIGGQGSSAGCSCPAGRKASVGRRRPGFRLGRVARLWPGTIRNQPGATVSYSPGYSFSERPTRAQGRIHPRVEAGVAELLSVPGPACYHPSR